MTSKRNIKSNQSRISMLICMILFLPQINYYINILFQVGYSYSFSYFTPVLYGFIIMISIYSYWTIFQRSTKAFLIVISIISVYIVNYLIFVNNRPFIFTEILDGVYNPTYRLFFYALPLLVLALKIFDYDTLYKIIYKYSVINTSVGVITYIVVVVFQGGKIEYMTFSYNLLFGLSICTYHAFENKSRLSQFLALAGVLVLLFGGARGALVTFLTFLLLYSIFLRKNRLNYKSLFLSSFLGMVLIYTYLNFESIVRSLMVFGSDFGINSRTLSQIAEGSFLESYGRTNIREVLIAGITDSPITGYGLWGDRFVTLNYGHGKASYAHNIFLEIVTQFGVILGIFLIITLLWLIIKKVYHNDRSYYFVILFCVIPSGLIKLFFSGSYLNEPYFFFLIGLLFYRHIRIKNHVSLES